MDYKVFGCKTNRYFAEKWLTHPYLEGKEGYFIASCVVTDKAKAKWVKHALQKLRTLKDDEKLYLSGCGNIRDGVVDQRFYEVYDELANWKEKIEILPEDADDWQIPFGSEARGDSRVSETLLGRGDEPKAKGGSPVPEVYNKGLYIPFRIDLEEKARELRKNMTGPEKHIWYHLLMNKKFEGYKFVRQKPMLDYIVDFYCHELRLVIEIDGESHIDQKEYDRERDTALQELGITTLRFTNLDTTRNLENIRHQLLQYIGTKKDYPTFSREPLRPTGTSPSKGSLKQIFTRKFLVIQTGCDNFCTFCLTVQARGRHKWRPLEEIIEEVTRFVEGGGKEVVLTGINLGAWGASSSNDYEESKFVELVEHIVEKTTIERIRISSLGVEFCSDRLISLFTHPRIIAYPHLSIQSGSTSILEKMGRHYDGDFLRSVLTKLSKVERSDGVRLNVGADIIVGFPGETDADFLQTLELIESYGVSQLHAFPFSAHIDHYSVPAGKFSNQVPNHIIQKRLKTLLEAGKNAQQAFAEKHIGKELRVLVEKCSPTSFVIPTKEESLSKSSIENLDIFASKMQEKGMHPTQMSSCFASLVLGSMAPLKQYGNKFQHKVQGRTPTAGQIKEVVHFSGWSENYLACDESNFTPFPGQKIARGEVVRGMYQGDDN